MNITRLLLITICASTIFSNIGHPLAKAQTNSIYREAMVPRCQRVANEKYADLERRNLHEEAEANYYVVYLPQNRQCLLFSSYQRQRPPVFSITNNRLQAIQVDAFTNDGSYLRVYSHWRETRLEYGASDPRTTQTWHAVIAGVNVSRIVGGTEPILRFGEHKLEVSLTSSGMITEYRVGSSQVAEQYLPEIREALRQINQYRLPLNSRPF